MTKEVELEEKLRDRIRLLEDEASKFQEIMADDQKDLTALKGAYQTIVDEIKDERQKNTELKDLLYNARHYFEEAKKVLSNFRRQLAQLDEQSHLFSDIIEAINEGLQDRPIPNKPLRG